MSEENKKPKTVIIKTIDEKTERTKRRTKMLIVIAAVLVLDIILAAIFIPRAIKRSKEAGQSSSYVVDEKTEARYENMLSYINKERTEVGKTELNEIVVLEYSNKKLKITAKSEEIPSYIEIKATITEEMTSILEIFDNEVLPGQYETSFQDETISTKELNISKKAATGIVTAKNDKDYVSFIANDGHSMLSSCHQEYKEDGLYNYTSVTASSDKLLYDFLYYLSNK